MRGGLNTHTAHTEIEYGQKVRPWGTGSTMVSGLDRDQQARPTASCSPPDFHAPLREDPEHDQLFRE
jgi:hypothetical protein